MEGTERGSGGSSSSGSVHEAGPRRVWGTHEGSEEGMYIILSCSSVVHTMLGECCNVHVHVSSSSYFLIGLKTCALYWSAARFVDV